jgi:fatty-acyl-CoA synthase
MELRTLCDIFYYSVETYGKSEHLKVKRGGEWRAISSAEFLSAVEELSMGLRALGVEKGDRVAILCENRPEWAYADLATLTAGATDAPVYCTLTPPQVLYILNDSESKVAFVSSAVQAAKVAEVRGQARCLRHVIRMDEAPIEGTLSLEELRAKGRAALARDKDAVRRRAAEVKPDDLATLIYTSGTTGDPKGVVYHHRGAYLLAMANVITCAMGKHPVYLWTLPMFHCNGWCFPWTLSVVAGPHVCLRAVRAAPIFDAIVTHKVTHLCGAPIVMSTLLNAAAHEKKPLPHKVEFVTAAAPPPEAVLAAMNAAGFNVTHVYGLTETYGPASVNDWHREWDALPASAQAAKKARQGVAYPVLDALDVRDPQTMQPVPRDGETLGEVMFRGNVVMKGYLKNPAATEREFAGGWFHSGDLGVIHPDGYIQLKDRSKDIIISGGENISSIEVEDALYKHPAVQAVAVVAKPDEKWGETPCAFVELKPGASATAEELIAWCRQNLAAYKCPRYVVFAEIPKTSTGKLQKFKLRDAAKGV